MTDSKVYIVQRAMYKDRGTGQWKDKFDLSPAEHFGELNYMLPHGNVPSDMTHTMRKLETALKDYDPGRDFLLALGDPVAIAASAIVAVNLHRHVNILKWDRRAQCYRPYVI